MAATLLAAGPHRFGGHGMSNPDMVALPASMLRLMMAGIFVAVVVMLAMLGVEIVILLRVFDMLDLIRRLAPPA
jgi:hypothetical protein